MDILKESLALQDYTTAIRRHLHENPELSGKEFNTIKLICQELDKTGVEYVNIPDGGVLATIDGPVPGKTVLLRADCDALPIQELPCNAKKPKVCVSQIDGAAHMCGHDGHTAMLLSAAKVLKANVDKIKGRVYLLFERGEEGGNNIYYIMKYIQENKLHIDAAYAEHTDTSLTPGHVACQVGPAHAGAFSYLITLTGKGGHGSRPDKSNNPIDCFVSIYECIKSIRMNYIEPTTILTNSMGMVQSGTAGNVIPQTLSFSGTCRFYDAAAGNLFKQKLRQIVEAQAALFDCQVNFDRMTGPILPVINNAQLSAIGTKAIKEAMGDDAIQPKDLNMGSESFSVLCKYYPGVMMRIGIGNEEEGMTVGGHNPGFDLDESGLPYGTASYVAVALGFLNSDEKIEHEEYNEPMDELLKFCDQRIPPRYDSQQ
ncbi:MAG: M20 family metallopeptidase [Clostridiaceae bacterium]|nr:M20 family metallopeptidase [Clostridiaceae bacterium]